MHIILKTQCGAKHTRGNKTTRKKSDSLEIQAIERKRRKEKRYLEEMKIFLIEQHSISGPGLPPAHSG